MLSSLLTALNALTFLWLALIAANILAEVKEKDSNGTKIIFGSRINSNSSNDKGGPRILKIKVKSDEGSSKKAVINESQNVFITTDNPVGASSTITTTTKPESIINSPLLGTALRKRRKKEPRNPNYYYSISENINHQENEKYYGSNEDYYDQHYLNQGAEYYSNQQSHAYEDNYNTIPDYYDDYGNLNFYAVSTSEPWQPNYDNPDYYNYMPGPPPISPAPVNEFQPVAPDPLYYQRECHCPPPIQRQTCDNQAQTFLSALTNFGRSSWDLTRITALSSLPVILPILLLKLILVPIKIIKIISIIKLFVKIFIVLPFLFRVVFPTLSHVFEYFPLLFYHKIAHQASTHNHLPHDFSSTEARETEVTLNSTAARIEENALEIEECPVKVACEFGAFLSTATRDNFPSNVMNYLVLTADNAESLSVDRGNLTENSEEAYNAFIVALGKRWPQEMCSVYRCYLML